MAVKGITYEEELKKNPDLKEDDMQMLRDWYKKQPHLPPLTDAELALFLHSNYYRMEPTKATIDTYFTNSETVRILELLTSELRKSEC
ncbi:hypothetical protein E2986_11419 [Frieseomelitta varia]|uniref:Uncharacterized protein n=1 Tax=Frieseomelitta varia TaxID=561572 RepID=A0A833S7B8_9HYME|nr:hypothetical protein E2986_11419 [Frieseomelitta varia]